MWSATPEPRQLQSSNSSSGGYNGGENGGTINEGVDDVPSTSKALATPFRLGSSKQRATPVTALTTSTTPMSASSEPSTAPSTAPTPSTKSMKQRQIPARLSTSDVLAMDDEDFALDRGLSSRHSRRGRHGDHKQYDGSIAHPSTGRVLFFDDERDAYASSESLENTPSPRRSDGEPSRRPKSPRFQDGGSSQKSKTRRRKSSNRFPTSNLDADLSPVPYLVDDATLPRTSSSSSSTDIRSPNNWSSSDQSSPERNDPNLQNFISTPLAPITSPSKYRRHSRYPNARRSRSNGSSCVVETLTIDDQRRSIRMSSSSLSMSSIHSVPPDFDVSHPGSGGRPQVSTQAGARPLSPTGSSPLPSPSSSLVRISIKTVWKAGAALVLCLSAALSLVNFKLHGTATSKQVVDDILPLPLDLKQLVQLEDPRKKSLGRSPAGGGLRGIHPNIWNDVKKKKFPFSPKNKSPSVLSQKDEEPFPIVDKRMYSNKSSRGATLESADPRIFYFGGAPAIPSQHSPRKMQLYPADFSDNTQYYPLFDSDDEKLNQMEIREPYEDGECVPMKGWQTTFHPSCNGMHELDLANHQNKKEGGALNLFGTKGFWRNAWKLDTLGSIHQHDHNGPISYKNQTVVLKTLKYEHNFEDAHFEHDRIDAIAMERLTGSPHVINIYGFCGHSVITEYADGPRVGTLADKSKKKTLKRLEIARDIASGLADVHGIDGDGNSTFVHLDVNPANVVSVGGTLKLNDFNIGIIRRWNTTSNKHCGFPAQYPNPQWRSPEEANESQQLTEKVDVFSMGHIFFRLICGHEPWNKLEKGGRPSKEEVTEKVKKGILPHIPEDIMKTEDPEVKAIRDVMLQCYKFDPEKRPSARTVAETLGKHLKRLSKKSKKTT